VQLRKFLPVALDARQISSRWPTCWLLFLNTSSFFVLFIPRPVLFSWDGFLWNSCTKTCFTRVIFWDLLATTHIWLYPEQKTRCFRVALLTGTKKFKTLWVKKSDTTRCVQRTWSEVSSWLGTLCRPSAVHRRVHRSVLAKTSRVAQHDNKNGI
jgi:hypothetical protein